MSFCYCVSIHSAARELFETHLTRKYKILWCCAVDEGLCCPRMRKESQKVPLLWPVMATADIHTVLGELDLKYSTAFRHIWTKVESTQRFRDWKHVKTLELTTYRHRYFTNVSNTESRKRRFWCRSCRFAIVGLVRWIRWFLVGGIAFVTYETQAGTFPWYALFCAEWFESIGFLSQRKEWMQRWNMMATSMADAPWRLTSVEVWCCDLHGDFSVGRFIIFWLFVFFFPWHAIWFPMIYLIDWIHWSIRCISCFNRHFGHIVQVNMASDKRDKGKGEICLCRKDRLKWIKDVVLGVKATKAKEREKEKEKSASQNFHLWGVMCFILDCLR